MCMEILAIVCSAAGHKRNKLPYRLQKLIYFLHSGLGKILNNRTSMCITNQEYCFSILIKKKEKKKKHC
jgi:hypothetical protein